MATTVLTSKGQMTLPKPVRDRLKLKTGDRIEVIVQEDGTALLIPRTYRLADLEGVLPPPGHRATIDEMDEAVGRQVTALEAAARRR